MSRNRQHSRKRQKHLMTAALLLCLAVLGFSVWLLFVPNHLNHVGETSVLQSSTADPGTAAVTSDSGTVQNSDAQAFLAVLEGNTAQLSAGKWKSSDESVATVDSNGTVTGVKQGSCQITDGSSTYQVDVRRLEQREEGTYVDGILIVNKSYPLSENYDPGLQPVTKDAFQKLSDAAAQEGLDIYIGSDYRDYAYQVKIYNNYCNLYGWEQADSFSARPGYSEHQTGLTIDCNTIDDAFGDTQESVWLAQHCADYGFIIRFPKGKAVAHPLCGRGRGKRDTEIRSDPGRISGRGFRLCRTVAGINILFNLIEKPYWKVRLFCASVKSLFSNSVNHPQKKLTYLEYYVIIKPVRTKSQESESYGSI